MIEIIIRVDCEFLLFLKLQCKNEKVQINDILVLFRFESVPKTAELDTFDGVFRPSDPPTAELPPAAPVGAFPEDTVIVGVSDEGEGIAGGGLDVTYYNF